MRVLFNAMQAGNQSGTGRYVEELLRALVALEDGPELTVVWPEDVPAGEWADSVELQRHPRGLLRRFSLERRLYRMARDFDVVHYPATIGPLWPAYNIVLTVHDCIFMRHPEWFRWERAAYYRWAGRRSAQCAARIIADSNATTQDLHELMGIPPDQVTTVPLGVCDTFFPQPLESATRVRTKYGLPNKFFLYVGTLEPRKNLARVVRAWDNIADDTPEDLVIAGRVGWKTEELNTVIAAARHGNRIYRPGFIETDDLPVLLSAAQAFVWPSLYEGFGLPVLEAMACGTPVITSSTTSLPEVAGDAALLVDPCDEDKIAQAMTKLSSDKGLRAELSDSGRQRASEFTWKRCAKETLSVYRDISD